MSDQLDLVGRQPYYRPLTKTLHVSVRLPAPLVAWLRGLADDEHTTVTHKIRRVLEAEQRGSKYPVDVTNWLCRQAALVGAPGDVDVAVVAVVRHLAERWPNGCVLEPNPLELNQ